MNILLSLTFRNCKLFNLIRNETLFGGGFWSFIIFASLSECLMPLPLISFSSSFSFFFFKLSSCSDANKSSWCFPLEVSLFSAALISFPDSVLISPFLPSGESFESRLSEFFLSLESIFPLPFLQQYMQKRSFVDLRSIVISIQV